jgi:hypothetical protein
MIIKVLRGASNQNVKIIHDENQNRGTVLGFLERQHLRTGSIWSLQNVLDHLFLGADDSHLIQRS